MDKEVNKFSNIFGQLLIYWKTWVSIQSCDFLLAFQIVTYHPILSNDCKNVFPPALSSSIVLTLGVAYQEEQRGATISSM